MNALLGDEMVDAAKYGKKYVCFSCGCKFYDLNKPKAVCPRCKANQDENPTNAAAFDLSAEVPFPADEISDKLLPIDEEELEVAENDEEAELEEADIEEE